MPYVLTHKNEGGETVEVTLPAVMTMPNDALVMVDENGRIKGEISMGLTELMGHDIESMNDYAGEILAGSPLVEDINYKPVGITDDGQVRIEVSGNVLFLLKEEMEWQVKRGMGIPGP